MVSAGHEEPDPVGAQIAGDGGLSSLHSKLHTIHREMGVLQSTLLSAGEDGGDGRHANAPPGEMVRDFCLQTL